MTTILPPPIKNILWDVDGTLFETYPAITSAFDKALNELGHSLDLDAIDKLARRSVDHCVEALCERFQLDPNLLRARFAESYRLVSPADQPPFEGVRAVCAWIQERGGLNLIVTHRRVETTQGLLQAHDLTRLFAAIFSSEQGYARKPDPAMCQAAIQQFGLLPAETMMLGDRDLDIQAGRGAGVRTCLFQQAELSHPADLRIDHYRQLLEFLQA